MSLEDKRKWNDRYKNLDISLEPLDLVKEYAKEAKGKIALDIACGMGRHSRYLAKEGFFVDALDISPIALETLKNIKNIYPEEVDFDLYELEKNRYDLIVCTYFLQRSLFVQIKDALKEGAILLMETFVDDKTVFQPNINEKFLLKSHEIKNYFEKSCDILFYKEKFSMNPKGKRSVIASLAAKKRGLS